MKYYMNFDTGVFWTEDEVRQLYEQFRSEDFDSFDDYLEQMLDLGKQFEGGLVELPDKHYMVHGKRLTQDIMDTIAFYMDDDIREDLHNEIAPCTPDEFLTAYLYKDPEFEEVMEQEFGIKELKPYQVFIVGGNRDGDVLCSFYTEQEAIKEAQELWDELEDDLDPVCGGIGIVDGQGNPVDW